MIAELSQRRVFRVISGYAVVCFVILQIADVAFEPLGIGDDVLRIIIAGMLLALPLVAYLSWIFDVSPESSLQRSKTGRPWLEASITFIALFGLAFGAWFVLRPSTEPAPDVALTRTEPKAKSSFARPTIDTSSAESVIRVELQLEGWQDWKVATTPTPSLVISADGKNLVFVARNDTGVSSLKVRRLNELNTVELAGTEDAVQPFFSPDGNWIGYFDGDLMKRVSLDGGEPSIITSVAGQVDGASWGSDGRIYYAQDRAGLASISVSEGGHRVETKLDTNRGEGNHRLPHYLPGHRVLLYSIFIDDRQGIKHETWALNLDSGERQYLFDGIAPTFVDSGHIVYAKAEIGRNRSQEVMGGSLWAVPFDPDTIELTGPPRSIQNAIAGREGSAHAVSQTGVLVYLPKQGKTFGELVLLDAEGSRVLVDGPTFEHPQFSNDGKSIAVSVIEEGKTPAIWIYGVDSQVNRKVADNARFPLWNSDDQGLTFMQIGTGLLRQPLHNQKASEILVPHEQFIAPDGWIGQNKVLLYHGIYPNRGGFVYTLGADKKSHQRLNQRAAFPNLSADERWVAFCTWPRGIKVGNFPELSATTTLTNSGCTPHWDVDDTRIFYQSFNKLWAASVQENIEQGPVFGDSEFIADLGYPGISLYDVDHIGRIVIARHKDTDPKSPVLLMNWEANLN